jgi:hypothetical protein
MDALVRAKQEKRAVDLFIQNRNDGTQMDDHVYSKALHAAIKMKDSDMCKQIVGWVKEDGVSVRAGEILDAQIRNVEQGLEA